MVGPETVQDKGASERLAAGTLYDIRNRGYSRPA